MVMMKTSTRAQTRLDPAIKDGQGNIWHNVRYVVNAQLQRRIPGLLTAEPHFCFNLEWCSARYNHEVTSYS